MNKRCTNCGKYPFCKDIKEPGKPTDCKKWVKRNYGNEHEYPGKEGFKSGNN